MARARWESTLTLLRASFGILKREHPMTIRQLFYRLVSVRIIENCIGDYRRVSAVMTEARERGEIPWEWICDRSRPSYSQYSWTSLEDYGEVVANAYRKDYWQTQSRHVLILVEKDAVVGSIQPVADQYGVTIRTLRGFSSATVAHEIGAEFCELDKAGKQIHVLYLGDHDPSGIGIEHDIETRIEDFMPDDIMKQCGLDAKEAHRAMLLARIPKQARQEIMDRARKISEYGDDWEGHISFRLSCRHLGLNPKTACQPFVLRRLAIHPEDIQKFNLPPLRVKTKDPRASGFLREHGDEAVELDALPPSELRWRLSRAIRALIDQPAWKRTMAVELAERETTRKVAKAFRGLGRA